MEGFNKQATYLSLCELYAEEIYNKKQKLEIGHSRNKNYFTYGNMFFDDRILHYFMVYVKNNIALNLAYIVKIHMFI